MRTLKIDRTEGQYTICTDKEKHFFAIDTKEMPKEALPGAIICIDDEGTITLEPQTVPKGTKKG